MAVDALLVVVVLGGDAFRYGEPPVTLRLGHGAEVQCLRIEVEAGRPLSPNARPFDYRTRLLDQLACRRGLEPSEAGGTRPGPSSA